MKKSAMHGESGYARRERDAYFTPEWVTRAMIEQMEIGEGSRVWEPAAGAGAMVNPLKSAGALVYASDIVAYDGFRLDETRDFLAFDRMPPGFTTICTNPPYDQAEKFIWHALDLTQGCQGDVIMLLRNEYDCAAGRREMWSWPFKMKLVLTRRPRWSDDSKASPRHNYAWFIWSWRSPIVPAVIDWL
jgi:hypothetical protein